MQLSKSALAAPGSPEGARNLWCASIPLNTGAKMVDRSGIEPLTSPARLYPTAGTGLRAKQALSPRPRI